MMAISKPKLAGYIYYPVTGEVKYMSILLILAVASGLAITVGRVGTVMLRENEN